MIVIKIQNLSKQFTSPMNLNLFGAAEAWPALMRILGFKPKYVVAQNIQRTISTAAEPVLENIDLEISKGSTICLTGPSGSGKSVLLKILAGVIPPSKGRIEINGGVNSLLSVGENLDPRMTAVDNIINYQRLIKGSKLLLDQYIKDVIDFAELYGFERMPVRTYSTGMMMRLSVAMALHGPASIYVIDDVLGVGDLTFQQKCIDRLQALRDSGKTLILALSDEYITQQLATKIISLYNGKIISGESQLNGFNRAINHISEIEYKITEHLPQNDFVKFQSIDAKVHYIDEKAFVRILLNVSVKVAGTECRTLIDVMQSKLVVFRSINPKNIKVNNSTLLTFTIEVPVHLLKDGIYKIMCGLVVIHNDVVYMLKAYEAISLKIIRSLDPFKEAYSSSNLLIPLSWEVEQLECGVSE